MRLVVVTQQVDPASPVLGATVDTLRALAARVDELVVLTDSTVVDSRSAVESRRLRRQCVNQSSTLTPVGRASGAASTA